MASLPLELARLVRPLIGHSGSNNRKAPLRPLCSPSPTHRQKCPDLIPDIMTASLCQLLAPCLQLPVAQFLTHMEAMFTMFIQLWPLKPKWGKNLTDFADHLSFYITTRAYLEIKSTQHVVIHFHGT